MQLKLKKWEKIVIANILADITRLSAQPEFWQPGMDRMASHRAWDAYHEALQGIAEINWRLWLGRSPTPSDLTQGSRAIRSLIDMGLVEPHFHKHATNCKAVSLTVTGKAAATELATEGKTKK